MSGHIVLNLIDRLFRILSSLLSKGEVGTIGTLEQIFIEVHENIGGEADIHVHMTIYKLR